MTRIVTDWRLLVVDDDPDITELVRDVAQEIGYVVEIANHFAGFKSAYEGQSMSAILLDLQMPDVDGVEYLRVLGEQKCEAEIVVMSGYDPRVLKAAVRLGREHGLSMQGALQKPMTVQALRDCLDGLTKPARFSPADEVAAALANREFKLFYQPKIKLREHGDRPASDEIRKMYGGKSWSLDSFEALSRWHRPGIGDISPEDFIPPIETQGHMRRFTDYVIELLAAQLSEWDDSGFNPSVSFNLSPVVMTDLALPDRLAKMCRAEKIETHRIIVEITETAAMTDIRVCMDILSRLRLKGFRVSMDDFGTGFSSLVQLHRMPFTELKIDKSIVCEIESSQGARMIARSIIDLAHNLELEVCAEGVENENTLNCLVDLGCDCAQGFYFGRAVPTQEAVDTWKSESVLSGRLEKS